MKDDYFTEYHEEKLKKMNTYFGVSLVALDVLKSMPQPIGQVCGNISSGEKIHEMK